MIEVEGKVKIGSYSEYRKIIESLGKYTGKQVKVDWYYTLEEGNKYPKKSLRIRKKGNIYQVNFKNHLSFIDGIHAKREVEFKIDDIKDFLRLIKEFGFRKWLVKKKVTYLYEINKNFHIEINKVSELGWFLEVEYLADLEDVKKCREKVVEVIRKLGFDEKDIIKSGYTKMLWNKRK